MLAFYIVCDNKNENTR